MNITEIQGPAAGKLERFWLLFGSDAQLACLYLSNIASM
jgi:hypothetical protein